MNLCIDQGNSRTKVALFEADGGIVKHFLYKCFTSDDVQKLFTLYSIQDCIISSVVNIEPSVVNSLTRLSQRFVLFDHQTPLPIKNAYRSPDTLGLDRVAAAVGAATLYEKQNVLIIDMGTAVTYDFYSVEQGFVGGNIAPGMKMRLKALKQMTNKLPEVEIEPNPILPLFGTTTHEAIASGVLRGICFEVKGYMRSLREQGVKHITCLTGGNAPYILNQVKAPMQYEPHLVLIGLNKILEFNKR